MASQPKTIPDSRPEVTKAKAAATTTAKPVAKPAPIAKPIKPAFQIKRGASKTQYLNLLVYGDYGQGKTYLAGTAVDMPYMNDVIMLNAESGDLTLAGDFDGHEFSKIDTVAVSDFKQVSSMYNFLKAHCIFRDEDNTEKLIELEERLTGETGITKPRKYRTVIVDSLTELDTYSMNLVLGINDKTAADADVASAEWSDFRKNKHQLGRTIRNFRDLPMHVIFICSRIYQQDESKKMIFQPALTGQLSSSAQGFVDMVGYLVSVTREDGETERRLHVMPTGRWAAKNRFSAFKKPYFENPTMASILREVGLSDT